ncbi:MAG: chemotaxis response regulator CheB [Candidatus Paceibacteria bacterium]|jgi:chemotaxis response regulator CheB
MRPIPRRGPIPPVPQSPGDQNPVPGAPSPASASPAQMSPQQNLQDRPAESGLNPRTTKAWFEHRNRSSPVPQQLGEQHSEPGSLPPTPTDFKRTSAQAHLPTSPRPRSEQRTEPQEPGGDSFLDSRSLLPQATQAGQNFPLSPGSPPHALMNPDIAGALAPFLDHDEQDLPSEDEQDIFALLAQGVDEVAQFMDQFEQNLPSEPEQMLRALLAGEEISPPAAAHGAGPVLRQQPMDSDSLVPGTSYAEALMNDLQNLGYTQKQSSAIKPESRSEVIKHHQTLTDKCFTHDQIVKVSRRAQSLGFLAERCTDLFTQLPDLTDNHVLDIAKGRAGDLALEELLRVAEDLHEDKRRLNEVSLRFNTEQLVRIAKRGERPALNAVHSLRYELSGEPHKLTPEQVVAVVSNKGGKQALEAVKALLPVLINEPYKLTPGQVVAIASNDGGKQALEAVKALLPVLITEPYKLPPGQVVAIASNIGGKQALETVKALLPVLINEPYKLSPVQLVAIASNGGGKQALEAVKALLPVLINEPYKLTSGQVVAIASNIGGKPALETVKALLPVLINEPYKLTPAQVVAIASNIGGKQALVAVKALLPVLINEPHNLTSEQVVAIASNGGKPALELRCEAIFAEPFRCQTSTTPTAAITFRR